MATLKLIADEMSDALNRPFDDMLKERIKSIFKHQLATMIRQQLNKTGVDDQFKTRFSINCSPVSISDSPFIGITDITLASGKWLRSDNKIPKPIRYTTDDPFVYVGITDGLVPFIYTKLFEFPYTSYLQAVQQSWQVVDGDTIQYPHRYFYNNDYIYVYYDAGDSETKALKLLIDGVFLGFDNVKTSTNDDYVNGTIFNDDYEFPMPDDMIQLVKEMLYKGELSITDDKDKIKAEHIDNN